MRGSIPYSVHKLEYAVQFSTRSTSAITVFPNSTIRVIAPEGTSQQDIEVRLRKRARWIVRQLMHFEQFRPRSPARRYVGGETHLYLGRQYRLKVSKGSKERVILEGAFLHVSSPKYRDQSAVKRLVCGWYREKGRERIGHRFKLVSARFEKIVRRPQLPILRPMLRRWGSLSSNGRISLNPDLIRAPTMCIDYVITHELIHLIHPHHGPAFHKLLDALMPDWRSRKERLERTLS